MEIKTGLIISSISLFLLLVYAYKYLNKKQTFIIFLVAYALVVTVYLGGSVYYYNFTQRFHLFDPYYQVSPPEFNVPFSKNTDEFRILALGGSTTRDPQKEEAKNYPYLLEKMLQQRYPDKKITVLNGGMNWCCSKHSLMYYTEYGNLFKPDLVIVMDAINDVYRSFSPRNFSIGKFHPSYKHFFGAAYSGAVLNTLERCIVKNSSDELADYKEVKYPFSDFLAFETFKQNETSLVKYILSDSAQCLLVMQPSLYDENAADSVKSKFWFGKYLCNEIKNGNKIYPDASSMKMAMDSFTYAVNDVAIKHRAHVLNANEKIPKTTAYFYDDVHYTDAGAKKLAESVFDFINAENLIPQKRK